MTKESKFSPSKLQALTTGFASSVADVMCTHPLWTFKTLRQQGLNPRQVIEKSISNPLILYNGIAPNALTMLPLTTFRIFFSTLGDRYLKSTYGDDTPPIYAKLISSFISGAASSIIGSPTELIRTIKLKEASLSQKGKSRNFKELTQLFVREYGIMPLSNGMFAVSLRDGIYTAAFFTGAPALKSMLSDHINNSQISTIIAYTSVSLAASFLNHPFDTIKTNQHTAYAMQFLLREKVKSDIFSVVQDIIKKEGINGFWGGYSPRAIRFLIGLFVKATVIEKFNAFFLSEEQKNINNMNTTKSFLPGYTYKQKTPFGVTNEVKTKETSKKTRYSPSK